MPQKKSTGRGKVIVFRIPALEYRQLEHNAEMLGMNVNSYCKELSTNISYSAIAQMRKDLFTMKEEIEAINVGTEFSVLLFQDLVKRLLYKFEISQKELLTIEEKKQIFANIENNTIEKARNTAFKKLLKSYKGEIDSDILMLNKFKKELLSAEKEEIKNDLENNKSD